MKYEVIKMFCDKETGEIKLIGSFHEYNQKRANELIKLGFLEAKNEQQKDQVTVIEDKPKRTRKKASE